MTYKYIAHFIHNKKKKKYFKYFPNSRKILLITIFNFIPRKVITMIKMIEFHVYQKIFGPNDDFYTIKSFFMIIFIF